MNQRVVPIWFFNVPLNFGLYWCSKNQTISIVYIKTTPVINHIFQVRGFKNIHADPSGCAGTIMDNPDSAYGWVNSTYFVRLANIVKSPTTASNVFHCLWSVQNKQSFIRNEFITEKLNKTIDKWKKCGLFTTYFSHRFTPRVFSLSFKLRLSPKLLWQCFLLCKLEMRSFKVMRNHKKKILYKFISSTVKTHFSSHSSIVEIWPIENLTRRLFSWQDQDCREFTHLFFFLYKIIKVKKKS